MNNEIVLLRRIEELEKLIQRQPEIGGVWQDWTPTFSASGSMTISNLSITEAKYMLIGKTCFFYLRAQFTIGGTVSTLVYATAPVKIADAYPLFTAITGDSTFNLGIGLRAGSTLLQWGKNDGSNWTLGAGRQARMSGFFRIA